MLSLTKSRKVGKTFFFKLFLLITVLLLSNANLISQVNWSKYPGNPFLTGQPGTWYAYVSMSSVLYNADSSRYEMWFTCGAQADFPYDIGYAWSYDGISWNVYSSNPVLTPTSGSWDAYTVIAPFVLRENGQYKMWYTGRETSSSGSRIGYATSLNGLNWTKHTYPILEAGTETWESFAVTYPCVMQYLNGYKMWYSGSSSGASQTGIGYATSLDGINWQRDTLNNPVLLSGALGQWDRIIYGPRVLIIDNLYYIFYTGEINLYQSDKVGLATSSDGIHYWNKHASNPVLQPTTGQWDGSRIILGSVLMDADTLKMYYAGTNGPNWQIGLATSPFEPVSVEDKETVPTEYSLEQNYPNPFNPSTTFRFSIPKTSKVVIKVYDILGNEIETIVKEEKPTGIYEITWDAENLPSGIYFYRIQAGSFIETKKMILLK